MQVPASALNLNLQEVWNVISAQRDLDLPAHKVMVAHIRCKDIAAEQLAAVQQDSAWINLIDEASSGLTLLSDFGSRASALIESCLYGYDTDAMYFVESVRSEQKAELRHGLSSALQPAFEAQRDLLHTQLLKKFEAALAHVQTNADENFVDVAKCLIAELSAQYDGTTCRS